MFFRVEGRWGGNPAKIVGVALITLGILALVYGGFGYSGTSHEAKIGALEFSVKDTEAVNVPVWAGVIAVVVGGLAIRVPNRS